MIRNTSPAKSPKRLGSQWAAIPESPRLNSGLYRQPSGAKKPPQTTRSSLFRHGPRSDTSVRSPERSRPAAPGETTGAGDGDVAVMTDRTGSAAGADDAAEAIATDPAAAHDERLGGAAAGVADRVGNPRFVKIATAT